VKTFSPKASDIQRKWWLLDANDRVLGRIATEAARLLRGKHKPTFAPHMDMGDFVIIVNAGKIRLTGNKAAQKEYIRHSGYPGGITRVPYEKLLATRPSFAVERAVKGMLPHNRLGRAMAKKLKVYDGPEHPHSSQKPEPYEQKELIR
jgi:large subunit ribosomal protein L13